MLIEEYKKISCSQGAAGYQEARASILDAIATKGYCVAYNNRQKMLTLLQKNENGTWLSGLRGPIQEFSEDIWDMVSAIEG